MARPVPAGAAPRPVTHGAVAGQEPDAPADDGTGGSADDEVDEDPPPGAPDQRHHPPAQLGPRAHRGGRPGRRRCRSSCSWRSSPASATIALLAARDVRRSRARRARRAAEPDRPAEPAAAGRRPAPAAQSERAVLLAGAELAEHAGPQRVARSNTVGRRRRTCRRR